MNQIILQQLRNILIDGKFPSTIVKVEGVSFEFTFTDNDIILCNTVIDYIEFLSKVVKCTIHNVPLIDLPSVYLYPLQTAYSEFQCNILRTLLDAVVEFVESAESQGLWLIYKHSDPSHILSIDCKLNIIQQRWIALNVVNDTKDNMEMIADIFENIKPWLDKELFVKIKEHTDDTRENVFFDDDSYDAELREKAKQIAKAQQAAADDATTIIVVEEED